MKKIKLLPSVLMLALCIGILGIGIYAATPTNNVITGTITVNAANAGIKVEVFEGQDATGTKKGEATGRTTTTIPIGDVLIDASNALTLEDVPTKYYTIKFSTTSTHKFIVDTETVQLIDGKVTETQETKEDAIIITKNHKKYLEDNGEGGTGLAYFTADIKDGETITTDNSYLITVAIKLWQLPEQAFGATLNMQFDVYKIEDWVKEGNTGINGIDYLHLGEYPQAKSTETTGFGEKVGEFGAYNDAATKTSEIETTRNVYAKDGKRYVEMSGSYYEIQPLKWRILSTTNGYSLMCDTVIEQVYYQQFYNGDYAIIDGVTSDTIYANNYYYSTLRKFMNETFYTSAFSDAERALIQKTMVKNDDASMGGTDEKGYSCENLECNDYIFALSYEEALMSDYGFATSLGSSDTRKIASSDYAKDTGVYTNNGSGYWWLRSPYADDASGARYVHYAGRVGHNYVYYDDPGCVPALLLGL